MHEPAEGKCIITRSDTVIDSPERFISRNVLPGAGALNRVMLTFQCIKTLGWSDSCRTQEPSFAKGTR